MNRLTLKSSRLFAALLAAGVIGGASVAAVQELTPAQAQPSAAVQAVAPAAVATPDFAAIAARCSIRRGPRTNIRA